MTFPDILKNKYQHSDKIRFLTNKVYFYEIMDANVEREFKSDYDLIVRAFSCGAGKGLLNMIQAERRPTQEETNLYREKLRIKTGMSVEQAQITAEYLFYMVGWNETVFTKKTSETFNGKKNKKWEIVALAVLAMFLVLFLFNKVIMPNSNRGGIEKAISNLDSHYLQSVDPLGLIHYLGTKMRDDTVRIGYFNFVKNGRVYSADFECQYLDKMSPLYTIGGGISTTSADIVDGVWYEFPPLSLNEIREIIEDVACMFSNENDDHVIYGGLNGDESYMSDSVFVSKMEEFRKSNDICDSFEITWPNNYIKVLISIEHDFTGIAFCTELE